MRSTVLSNSGYSPDLTEGIQGEMPCLDPTKYHLGLQVRVKRNSHT